MRALLLKYLTPMTWVLWGTLGVGMINSFFLEPRGIAVLRPDALNLMIYLLWPLLLAVWFGWKEKKKQEELAARAHVADDATN